jgi:hypothetical protein
MAAPGGRSGSYTETRRQPAGSITDRPTAVAKSRPPSVSIARPARTNPVFE